MGEAVSLPHRRFWSWIQIMAARTGTFPTAHRSAAKAFASPAPEWGPGFQRPPSVPGVPANDNWPSRPPANDNYKPPYIGRPTPPPPWQLGKAASVAGFGIKALPYISWIATSWEAYQLYQQLYGAPEPGAMGWTLNGWEYMGPCLASGPFDKHLAQFISTAYSGYSTWCLANQFPTSAHKNPGTPVVWSGANVYRQWTWRNPGTWTRLDTIHPFRRPLPAESGFENTPPVWETQPGTPPRWVPPEVPWFRPQVDPMAVPIGIPMPTPLPLPYPSIPHRVPNPGRAPQEQTEWGPRPNFQPRPNGRPAPRPVTAPATPGATITVRPGRKPKLQHWKRPHKPKKPPKGQKEKKFNAAKGGFPGFVFSALTEAMDVIRPIWNALPDHWQSSTNPNPVEMVQDIANGWHVIDWQKAMQGIAANAVEDGVFGLVGKTVAKGSANLGKGIQHGPAL